MPKPKPLTPTSIKFTEAQKTFLKRMAIAQGHYNISAVVKRLVDREMGTRLTAA
jgi:hypothetical protein